MSTIHPQSTSTGGSGTSMHDTKQQTRSQPVDGAFYCSDKRLNGQWSDDRSSCSAGSEVTVHDLVHMLTSLWTLNHQMTYEAHLWAHTHTHTRRKECDHCHIICLCWWIPDASHETSSPRWPTNTFFILSALSLSLSISLILDSIDFLFVPFSLSLSLSHEEKRNAQSPTTWPALYFSCSLQSCTYTVYVESTFSNTAHWYFAVETCCRVFLERFSFHIIWF